MAKKKLGPRPTYMLPKDFTALGEKLFGEGWQTRMGAYIGFSRVQIGRYANGNVPIPAPLAISMHMLSYCLDHGIPIDPIFPVGTIDDDGRLEPAVGGSRVIVKQAIEIDSFGGSKNRDRREQTVATLSGTH